MDIKTESIMQKVNSINSCSVDFLQLPGIYVEWNYKSASKKLFLKRSFYYFHNRNQCNFLIFLWYFSDSLNSIVIILMSNLYVSKLLRTSAKKCKNIHVNRSEICKRYWFYCQASSTCNSGQMSLLIVLTNRFNKH